MKIAIIFFITTLIPYDIFGQVISIAERIQNETGQPIPSANITPLRLKKEIQLLLILFLIKMENIH